MKRFTSALVLMAAVGATLSAAVKFTSTWKSPDAGTVSFAGKKVAALVISKDDSLRVVRRRGARHRADRARTPGGRDLPHRSEGGAPVRGPRESVVRQGERRRGCGDPARERRQAQTYTPGIWMNPYYSTFHGLLRLRVGKRLHSRSRGQ